MAEASLSPDKIITVDYLFSLVTKLSLEVETLQKTVQQHEETISQLKLEHATALSPELAASFIETNQQEGFLRFLEINRNTEARAEQKARHEKQRKLYDLFCCMNKLEQIGQENEKIFSLLQLYYSIVESILPNDDENRSLFAWWYSAQTQGIKISEIETAVGNCQCDESAKKVLVEQLLEIIAEFKADTDLLEISDIDQIKERICHRLDRSGISICEKMKVLVADFAGDEDPAEFLKHHVMALANDDHVTEEQKHRLIQFAETCVIGDEWVHVPTDGGSCDDPTWFQQICGNIKSACSLRGKNQTVDSWLDVAKEYKSTCDHVKNSLGWVYFGGRMAIDPAGALLSLLW